MRVIAAVLAALVLTGQAGQPKKPKPRRLSKKPLRKSHPYEGNSPESKAAQRANLTDEGRRNGAAKPGEARAFKHGAYAELSTLSARKRKTFRQTARDVEANLESAGSLDDAYKLAGETYLRTFYRFRVLDDQPELPIEAEKIRLRLADQLTEMAERLGLTPSSQSKLRLRQARELESRRVVPVVMQGGPRAAERAREVALLLRDLGVIPDPNNIVDADVIEDDEAPSQLPESALRELGLHDRRAER